MTKAKQLSFYINEELSITDVKTTKLLLKDYVGFEPDLNDIKDFVLSRKGLDFYLNDSYQKVNKNEAIRVLIDTGFKSNNQQEEQTREPIFLSLFSSNEVGSNPVSFDGFAVTTFSELLKNCQNIDSKKISGENLEVIFFNLRNCALEYYNKFYRTEDNNNLAIDILNENQKEDVSSEAKIEKVEPLFLPNTISMQDTESIKTEAEDAEEFIYQKERIYTMIKNIEKNDITEGLKHLLFNPFGSEDGLLDYTYLIGKKLPFLIKNPGFECFYLCSTADENCYLVNTGLINSFGSDIYIAYKITDKDDYIPAFVVESPHIAQTYGFNFTGGLNIIDFHAAAKELSNEALLDFIKNSPLDYDTKTNIVYNQKDRFPKEVQNWNDRQLADLLNEAFFIGKKILSRNNNYMLPIYNENTDSFDYLLPLHIFRELTDTPEMVFVIKYQDKSWQVTEVQNFESMDYAKQDFLNIYHRLCHLTYPSANPISVVNTGEK